MLPIHTNDFGQFSFAQPGGVTLRDNPTPGRNLHTLKSMSEVPAIKKWNWTLYFYSIKCLTCQSDVSFRDWWVRLISALPNTKSSVIPLLLPLVTFVNWAKFELIYPLSLRQNILLHQSFPRKTLGNIFGCSQKCSYQRGLPRPSWQDVRCRYYLGWGSTKC